LTVGEEGMYWLVSNRFALMKIDFEDVGTVLGKCHNGRVFELVTIIEFKLDIISMECCTKKA
jgi:hypothetical protein